MAAWRRLAAPLLAAIACLLLSVTARADAGDRFFDQTFGDLRAELASARDQGKRGLLLVFEADDCPYCHRMRVQVLDRADVQDYYRQRFVIVRVDVLGDVPLTDVVGRDTTEKRLAAAYRIRGTPTYVFVGPDGVEQARYAGATPDARTFLLLGRFVADGHFKHQGFEAFLAAAKGK